MKKILVIAEYYLPGYKGGGPIQTLKNMVDWLGEDFEFYILTADRDLGDTQPYDNIQYDEWTQIGNAKVRYLAPKETSSSGWISLLNSIEYDVLYLNSFFAKYNVKIMWLNRFGRIPKTPIILAPRGEFYDSALGKKSVKKMPYLLLSKLFGIYKSVTVWQASDNNEKQAISLMFSFAMNKTHVALNFMPRALHPFQAKTSKSDLTKIAFLSRIARVKNLDYAFKVLANVTEGDIQFDIHGSLEDEQYWQECQSLIAALPSNITIQYHGGIEHHKINDTLSQYHLFFLPTQGENFGHVIWEALYAGCPVLISDQTPWCNLKEKGVGWDIPLGNQQGFVAAINEMIDMDESTFQRWSQSAHDYAQHVAHDETTLEANSQLFMKALGI